MPVTIIGGTSCQWAPALLADLLLTPSFADGGHLVLEDIDPAVEAMCMVDADGVRGRDAARVPPAVAELLRRHVATQELTVEAALTGDRELVRPARLLDPLAGRGDLRRADAMADELLAGTSVWLPQFSG
jgi:alpha-galactosidase/6-phospho-beta-glucosidase family protein